MQSLTVALCSYPSCLDSLTLELGLCGETGWCKCDSKEREGRNGSGLEDHQDTVTQNVPSLGLCWYCVLPKGLSTVLCDSYGL